MTYRGCSLAAMQSPGLTPVNYIIYYTWESSQSDSAHFTVMLGKAAFFFFFLLLFLFLLALRSKRFVHAFVAWRGVHTTLPTGRKSVVLLC